MNSQMLLAQANRTQAVMASIGKQFELSVEDDDNIEDRERISTLYYLLEDFVSELVVTCKKVATNMIVCDAIESSHCNDFLEDMTSQQNILQWDYADLVQRIIGAPKGSRIVLRSGNEECQFIKKDATNWQSREENLGDYEIAEKAIKDYEIGVLLVKMEV